LERLIESVDGVVVLFVGHREMERAIETDFVDGFAAVGDVDGFDGLAGVIDEHVVARGGEGAAIGENVHVDIHGRNFGLRQTLIFFVELFVIGQAMAIFLVGAKFIEAVRVVVEPAAAGYCEREETNRSRDQAAQARARETQARGPG